MPKTLLKIETLKEWITKKGQSISSFSIAAGITEQHMHKLLNGAVVGNKSIKGILAVTGLEYDEIFEMEKAEE